MSLSPAEVSAILADPTIKIDNLYGVQGSPGFFGNMGGLFTSGFNQPVGSVTRGEVGTTDNPDRLKTGGSFSPGGQASAISAVLAATGPTETAAGKATIERVIKQAVLLLKAENV